MGDLLNQNVNKPGTEVSGTEKVLQMQADGRDIDPNVDGSAEMTDAEIEKAAVVVSQMEGDKPTTKVDDIKKEYFPSGKLAEAQVAIDKVNIIADEHDLAMVFNFDVEAEFPSGYGMALIPVTKNIEGKNVTVSVAVAAIPDLETVAAFEGGQQFIAKSVVGSMIAKLSNAVRPRGETGETAASIPFSVADFITSNRPEGVLLAYRKLANAYVKVLKKKGLLYITESILRQILQSAAFAEQQFPTITQEKWEQILDSMIVRAEADELAPGMLVEWRKSRNSAELVDTDVDLSDIDFDNLLSTPETTAEAPTAQ